MKDLPEILAWRTSGPMRISEPINGLVAMRAQQGELLLHRR